MLACGWAVCMTFLRRIKGMCGAPGIWAGRSRQPSAPKCALPDRPVVCFTGDAGFWYHIGEIETMVRWNINAVIVVNNNSAGNQSKTGFDRAYGGKQTEKAREIWNFTHVNFANVANEIGALGIRVEKPGDFKSALDQALAQVDLSLLTSSQTLMQSLR